MAAEPARSIVAAPPFAATGMGWWMFALLLGLAAAPLVLPLVPGPDQQLFLDHAQAMREGATLYVQVWDNKQPGVFGLYAALQATFGAGWHGVLLGYAAGIALAAALAARAVRVASPHGLAALLVVPFTLGLLYLRSSVDHVAQVETWVVLPLSAILLLAVLPDRAGRLSAPRWLAIGAATAVVALLKLVLLPVAAAIVAAMLALRVAFEGLGWRHASAAVGVSVAGFALVVAPVAAAFVVAGAWEAFWWTSFVYPGLAVGATETAPIARLAGSLQWLAKSVLGLLPLVAFALVAAWRAPREPVARLAAGALAWILAGFGMILVQKFSWWTYHMALVMWPLGVLAALGWASHGRPAGRGLRLARAVGVAWLVVLAAHLAWKWAASPAWPYKAGQLEAIDTARTVARDATIRCGTVAAIGDQSGAPSATGLRKALPTHAIFWGAYLPAQTLRLPDELEAARPDLVYVDGAQRDDLRRRFPEVANRIQRWLAADYVSRATDPFDGRWYERAPHARGGPCPAPTRFVIPGR